MFHVFFILLLSLSSSARATCETPGQPHVFTSGVQSSACSPTADACVLQQQVNAQVVQMNALQAQMDVLDAEMTAYQASEIVKYSSSFVQGAAAGTSAVTVDFAGGGSTRVFPPWQNATAQELPTLGLDAGGTNVTAPASGVYQLALSATFRNLATYDNLSDYNVYLFFGMTQASLPSTEVEVPLLQFYLNQGHDPSAQPDITVGGNLLWPFSAGDHFRMWWKQATAGDFPLRQVSVRSATLGVRFVRAGNTVFSEDVGTNNCTLGQNTTLCGLQAQTNSNNASIVALQETLVAMEATHEALQAATDAAQYLGSWALYKAAGGSPTAFSFASTNPRLFPAWTAVPGLGAPLVSMTGSGTTVTLPATGVYEVSLMLTMVPPVYADGCESATPVDYRYWVYLEGTSFPGSQLDLLRFSLPNGHTAVDYASVSATLLQKFTANDTFQVWMEDMSRPTSTTTPTIWGARLNVLFVR